MTAYRESDRDDLSQLDEPEVRTLVKLVRLLVRADGGLSGAEREHVGFVAEAVGADAFWGLMDEVSELDESLEQVLEQAKALEQKDAQELIYGTLFELSIQDFMAGGEGDLLDRLQATWGLQIDEVPPEE